MSNGQLNSSFSKELGKQSRERLYTKEELKQLQIEQNLTDEEVQHLKTQRKYCDTTRFQKATANRNDLIKSVMLMVVKVARSYWYATGKQNVTLDDVVQAGNLGATIAADNYLKTVLPAGKQHAKFSTYAYPWIKKYVLDELNITSQQLTTGTRGAYSNALQGKQFISKDDTMPGKESDYESPINNDLQSDLKSGQEILEIEQQRKQNTSILSRAFSKLSSQEMNVLTDVYGLGDADILSQIECSRKYGLSTSAINAIIKRAHHKIYWALTDSERDMMANYDTTAGVDIRSILCSYEDQPV
jgi:RNA polymerase sigma factor (sigma-70 family)